MVLASMDLWEFINGFEEAQHFHVVSKLLKKFRIHVQKAISIIGLNLVDDQLAHIKNYQELAKVWKSQYNIHKMKNLSNILFICSKCFMCNMHDSTTYWTTSTRSKPLKINSHVWRYPCKKKTSSWFLLKVCQCHTSMCLPPWKRCRWKNWWWSTWRHVWCTRCWNAKRKSLKPKMRRWCRVKAK